MVNDISIGIRVLLYLAVMVIMFLQYSQCKGMRRLSEPLGWGMFAFHGAIYCIVFLIDYRDRVIVPANYNLWASAVQLQGLITLISIEYARYQRLRGRGASGC